MKRMVWVIVLEYTAGSLVGDKGIDKLSKAGKLKLLKEKKILSEKIDIVDETIGKSKIISKTNLEYIPTSGVKLTATPGKTTTVLGTYTDDTNKILDELRNIKSTDFGPKDNGFNLLNTL